MPKATFSAPGISQAARISVGGRKNQVIRSQHCSKRAAVASAQRTAQLRGTFYLFISNTASYRYLSDMDLHQRERFLRAEHHITTPTPHPEESHGFDGNFDSDGFTNDVDISTIIPPIGEEGFSVSHSGGEIELYKELSNVLSSQRYCDHI